MSEEEPQQKVFQGVDLVDEQPYVMLDHHFITFDHHLKHYFLHYFCVERYQQFLKLF